MAKQPPKQTQAHTAAVLALLPQTQCQRCGYADCETYAQAIAQEGAPINQCQPGGQEGVARLAEFMQVAPIPSLNPEYGFEAERSTVQIDEDWCIGCTLCLDACPVDAIIGSNKQMHTIASAHCTGCELCIPVCPVDCIELSIATPSRTGWQAWSPEQAQAAAQRYAQRKERIARSEAAQTQQLEHLSTFLKS